VGWENKIKNLNILGMIEYIPNFSKLPKRFVVLEILWKRGTTTSAWTNRLPTENVETFPVYQETIYTDLIKAEAKIQALKETWADDDKAMASKNILVFIPEGLLKASVETLEHILVRILTALYPFKGIGRRVILTHEDNEPRVGFDRLLILLNTIQQAKDMVMTPANIGTPMTMAKRIQKMMGGGSGVRSHVYDVAELRKKKFGLILSVGESAKNPPCMLVLDREGVGKGGKTICLVGKGITFDSGGLSLKSVDGMADMKYDKTGAVYMAYVYQLLIADPAFRDHRLVAILPFAENAVGERATRFGDVVRSYGGKTVEITDPDGEGRLVLADAFSLAEEYKPDVLLDLATLTGHADTINAWSNGYAYCEPESLRFKLEKWTQNIGERMLTMPTWPEYAKMALKSDMADLVNCPRDNDDAFTAALFLRQFLPATVRSWVHIDLAHEFDNHVPSGHGIRTLHRLAHELI
jgi:leucyl aminopeptidase